ncbi:hypothetical protein [Streptomyces anulatus]|uniref:hypothetical protein n=1 Tax=Streptomyces anulatus TaxID=1892 RepID=UPI002255226B|nr:hypothetical protein [Streptomyces anulatus]MCX4506705.1 hypothetical protein [Streptomyces anulatus]
MPIATTMALAGQVDTVPALRQGHEGARLDGELIATIFVIGVFVLVAFIVPSVRALLFATLRRPRDTTVLTTTKNAANWQDQQSDSTAAPPDESDSRAFRVAKFRDEWVEFSSSDTRVTASYEAFASVEADSEGVTIWLVRGPTIRYEPDPAEAVAHFLQQVNFMVSRSQERDGRV